MGILDELKQQAEQQQGADTGASQAPPMGAEEFYAGHVKARMLTAFKFLDEFVNQLNQLKLVTRADYPFKPDGKAVVLQQQDYKVFSDSIPEPRSINLSFICALVNPSSFEINGRGQVLSHSELLDRFQFKYEKAEQKDARQMVSAARFKLVGPLQIKFTLQFDDKRHVIKLLVTNFTGPGTSQYHLQPDKLDEAFLDHLGKYILRKETSLFKEQVSADVKAMLRKKLQEEQLQRDSELQAVEEARRAEEALRRQNSATGQLKRAVSESMAKNTEKLKQAMNEQLGDKSEKLKTMFGRLKSQISPDKT